MEDGNLNSKSSNIFYIIAGGPSFLDVTEEEWKYLEDKNTISFARVPLSGRRTKYYFSIERESVDEDMLTYLRKLGYLDVKLLLYLQKSLKLAKDMGFNDIQRIQKQNFYFMSKGLPWFIDEENPPCSFFDTRAKHFRQPLFRYRGQLTAVINACIILGATEIRLIGVDLNTQWAFYDNIDYIKSICKDEETINRFTKFMGNYIKESIPEELKYNKDFNPETMHTTNMVLYEEKFNNRGQRGMADLLEWIDKEMKREGMEGIYTTSKSSYLCKNNKLLYKGIMD